MKNIVPLILAVVLGLAAVFAVKRLLTQKEAPGEEKVEVVVAARDLPEGTVLAETSFARKAVPRNAIPKKAVPWSQVRLLFKQKCQRSISSGDYMLWDDIGSAGGLSDIIGEGEWAVTVSFADSAIAAILRPGDEVAIIASFGATFSPDTKTIVVGNVAAPKPETESKEITTVLFPRVRILSVIGNEERRSLVLAMTPHQVQTVIAAQSVANLYPALRRPNDSSNLNRLETGMIDADAFNKMLKGVSNIEIPAVPDGLVK